ncbi:hypothetical protein [Pseudomonas sp. NFACC36]|uniref:hypothetical protein n=1 Tax=Pseudomonas sp. NFACC36 TaxID=1566197 RepID=UPI0009187DBA|nr:hypothetical protein [Pseudomonas sp. NFACC36]SFY11720.1 hypothetical protein SAMN03159309_04081 [Pseudomonas sp. NFACC36]
MDDGINVVLYVSLIGSKDRATIKISPLGEVRIDFASALNFLTAPANRLLIEDIELLLGQIPATEIHYQNPVEKQSFWKVTVGRADGDKLREVLRNNAQSRKEVFGLE